jgi:hypothetical protein
MTFDEYLYHVLISPKAAALLLSSYVYELNPCIVAIIAYQVVNTLQRESLHYNSHQHIVLKPHILKTDSDYNCTQFQSGYIYADCRSIKMWTKKSQADKKETINCDLQHLADYSRWKTFSRHLLYHTSTLTLLLCWLSSQFHCSTLPMQRSLQNIH